MATANLQDGSGQQQGGWQPGFWTGAATGGVAVAGYEGARQIASDAKTGKYLALGFGAINLLAGNSAMSSANTAMTAANLIGSSATYATDSPNVRTAMQNAITAIQQSTISGYTGLSTATQPSSAYNVAAPAATQNLTGILILGFFAFAMFRN